MLFRFHSTYRKNKNSEQTDAHAKASSPSVLARSANISGRNKLKEIGATSFTEVVILGFFVLPLISGSHLLITIMLFLLTLGVCYETIRLVGNLSLKRKIGLGMVYALVFFLLYNAYVPLIVHLIFASLAIILLIFNIYLPLGATMQKLLLGYPVLFIPFIAFLAFSTQHPKIILFTYLVVESFDSFAYLGGKIVGKTKAFPKLSPKKTVEGVLIGAVTAIAIGYIAAPYMIEFTQLELLTLVAIIIIGTLLGDLTASKLKRNIGVKDFGNILPQQGGILDIYDSIIFTAPIVFIYLIAIK
uniref:Phosphatidate cytidylyltransferase n=1 Tax=Candidatus Kentrum sp. TUN TaxID=2126343 RepID=A0A451AHZ6_9GAMM|nr:MAG: phosphatidate cytidylyltransferase [Candidatus Kentron sp. TUN]VFK62606.1 MAG: phosphatidate cytidylyltransferase [Candidatus Kentron sp. TUN]VFK65614.1 MAG: phosphatidate cytidylyltransferase [Candidatus Kentron sp. TUN]